MMIVKSVLCSADSAVVRQCLMIVKSVICSADSAVVPPALDDDSEVCALQR